MLDTPLRLSCYEGLTVFLLALASASRSRLSGERLLGSMLLGLVVGLAWPIAREVLLGGTCQAVFSSRLLLSALFLGALLGARWPEINLFSLERLAPYLDLLALSSCSSFGLICLWPSLEPPAGLFLALFLALWPQFLTDLALGDSARFVREVSPIFRAFFGTVLGLSVVYLGPWLGLKANFLPPDLLMMLLGLGVPLLLNRLLKN
ncbi:MAG: hypothetical protein IJS50_02840 [Desulfovibrio sp.]|nr:hypothetical protein [Desulfovibrio sp.]